MKPNWAQRKNTLETLILILDETEQIQRENYPDFPSKINMPEITIQGWRVPSSSLIYLFKEMFDKNLDGVV